MDTEQNSEANQGSKGERAWVFTAEDPEGTRYEGETLTPRRAEGMHFSFFEDSRVFGRMQKT